MSKEYFGESLPLSEDAEASRYALHKRIKELEAENKELEARCIGLAWAIPGDITGGAVRELRDKALREIAALRALADKVLKASTLWHLGRESAESCMTEITDHIRTKGIGEKP